MNNFLPAVLTIAGSDSGGGAGIQTDLRTFNAFKVYGCSAITAVTSQNPFEVRRIDILPIESVKNQLESVLDVFPVRFAKTGMLGDGKTVECVAMIAEKYDLNLIVDPVMVSTSGTKLLEDSAISALQEKLFPLAVDCFKYRRDHVVFEIPEPWNLLWAASLPDPYSADDGPCNGSVSG